MFLEFDFCKDKRYNCEVMINEQTLTFRGIVLSSRIDTELLEGAGIREKAREFRFIYGVFRIIDNSGIGRNSGMATMSQMVVFLNNKS